MQGLNDPPQPIDFEPSSAVLSFFVPTLAWPTRINPNGSALYKNGCRNVGELVVALRSQQHVSSLSVTDFVLFGGSQVTRLRFLSRKN